MYNFPSNFLRFSCFSHQTHSVLGSSSFYSIKTRILFLYLKINLIKSFRSGWSPGVRSWSLNTCTGRTIPIIRTSTWSTSRIVDINSSPSTNTSRFSPSKCLIHFRSYFLLSKEETAILQKRVITIIKCFVDCLYRIRKRSTACFIWQWPFPKAINNNVYFVPFMQNIVKTDRISYPVYSQELVIWS